MLELWQTEWCPASRRVRQRLTELSIDYVIRQVPVEKEQRHALLRATGTDTIPALVFDNGEIATGEDTILRLLSDAAIATGEDTILRLLSDAAPEPAQAEAHRQKAEKAHRRYLQEECECSQPATP
jgi:glutathione S-transferase